jgi:hypothetical protein
LLDKPHNANGNDQLRNRRNPRWVIYGHGPPGNACIALDRRDGQAV